MIHTVEVAPYIFASTLVDVVEKQLYENIRIATDNMGEFIVVDRENLRKAFLQVLLKKGGE